MDRRRFHNRRGPAVLALLLLAAVTAPGCILWNKRPGPVIEGQPDTKYYFLMGPFAFAATEYGNIPQARAYGGGPWWMPLEQCEIKPEGLKGWPEEYVTVKYVQGRRGEVGLWYHGIPGRRYEFRYDRAGRLTGRVETEYEPRRKGESVDDWVARMKGKTPAVTRVSEIAYVWSPDGRKVSVKMVGSRGEEVESGFPDWPDVHYGEGGELLETWEVDDSGHVVTVFNHAWAEGGTIYSATYDKAGRLLRIDAKDEVENSYDARGRIVKTVVERGIGDRMVFAHAYPGSPAPELPKETGFLVRGTFLVTHDKSGHITRVKVRRGEDAMDKFTIKLTRDAQGRVRRFGTALKAWFPIWGYWVFE